MSYKVTFVVDLIQGKSQVTTTSGIRPPYWNLRRRKHRVRLAYTPVNNLPPEHGLGIATEITSIAVSVAKLLVFPV